MDLMAEAKQKNDQLFLKNAVLQQHLCARVNAPKSSSFLITFILAPLIVGAVAQLALGAKQSVSHPLYRVVLSGLRFWPLLSCH